MDSRFLLSMIASLVVALGAAAEGPRPGGRAPEPANGRPPEQAKGRPAPDKPGRPPAKDAPPRLAADKVKVKCAVCAGRGSLRARPPDVGQFAGQITDRSHWDVKVNPCPICGRGRGWRTVWDLSHPEPSEEPPCTTCGWSGLTPCRKCLASGVVDCRHPDCRDGWIVPKQPSGARRSRKPPVVKPCPKCQGVGKVVCPDCQGMRANLCRKCFGTGRKR